MNGEIKNKFSKGKDEKIYLELEGITKQVMEAKKQGKRKPWKPTEDMKLQRYGVQQPKIMKKMAGNRKNCKKWVETP